MTNFKSTGQVIIPIDANGLVYEQDHLKECYVKRDEFLRGLDVCEFVQVLRITLNTGFVEDITEYVRDWFLDSIGSYVVYDDIFGTPAIAADIWDDLVEAEQADNEDHYRMMQDPMSYHFGPNWHGIKLGRGY